jgi:AcrR family transcriptional regulator
MLAVKQSRTPAQKRESKLPRLLDAAAQRFCEQGYDAASMRQIANDAGMKAGSMYYHFPSKSELLIAVHEEGIRRITEAVSHAASGDYEPWARLQAAMAAHLTALLDGGNYAQVVIRELPREPGAARQGLIEYRDSYEAIFRRLIDALPLPPEASKRHLRLLILGALNWSQTWYHDGGDRPDEIAAQFVSLLRQGHERR